VNIAATITTSRPSCSDAVRLSVRAIFRFPSSPGQCVHAGAHAKIGAAARAVLSR
jgi:hypothetical protein